MDPIRIIFDKEGNTLNVWFDDPSLEASCEETGDEVILVKDRTGRIIGFEKLNYLAHPTDVEELTVESEVS